MITKIEGVAINFVIDFDSELPRLYLTRRDEMGKVKTSTALMYFWELKILKSYIDEITLKGGRVQMKKKKGVNAKLKKAKTAKAKKALKAKK